MTKTVTQTPRYWPFIVLAAVTAGLVFVSPYLGVVCLAALMAYLFYPIFRRVKTKIRAPSFAAAITLVFSLFIVMLPLGVILLLTFVQLGALANELSMAYSSTNSGAGLPDFIRSTIEAINDALAPFSGQDAVVTGQGVIEFIRGTLPEVIKSLTVVLVGIIGSIPLAIILSIMYIVLFVEFLVYGKKLIEMIKTISPFDATITTHYLQRIGLMANAMAKGQLLISFIISVLSSTLLIFLGLGEYFFLMVVLFTILNLVPLGCGVVVIPITIIAILLGNVVPGIVVLVLYLIISNLDDVIRPRIIPKGAQLSAGLTMLAAFGGIYYYGLLGVVYGPVVMIIIVTTVSMYVSYKRGQPAISNATL